MQVCGRRTFFGCDRSLAHVANLRPRGAFCPRAQVSGFGFNLASVFLHSPLFFAVCVKKQNNPWTRSNYFFAKAQLRSVCENE